MNVNLKILTVPKFLIWGLLSFGINVFLMYQNYTKGFSLENSFFIEINQLLAFVMGLLYANQYKKFNLKYFIGILSNSALFSILYTIFFALLGVNVSFMFTLMFFIFIAICFSIGYGLFYLLFSPKRFKLKTKNTSKYKYSFKKNNVS